MPHPVAGCCQIAISPGDIDSNVAKVERALDNLAAKNCTIAVLPEMWSCGFPYRSLAAMARQTPLLLEKVRQWAVERRMVIVGSLPEADGGRIFNTSYVMDHTGDLRGAYRKVHLFSLHGEHKHFAHGNTPVVVSTSLGHLGVMICYDLRFPELSRRLALDGADILCFSALWPETRIDHWSLLLMARAIENQLFVLGCNGCGREGNLRYGGSSLIVSPMGTVLARAGEGEEVITAEVDMEEIRNFRSHIDCFGDRVPGAYEPDRAEGK